MKIKFGKRSSVALLALAAGSVASSGCSSGAAAPVAALGGGAGGGTSHQPDVGGAEPTYGGGGSGTLTGGSGGTIGGVAGASAGSLGVAGSADARVTLPSPADAASTDPDFLLQGEYVGLLTTAEGPKKLGAQVISVAKSQFRLVFEPGGLPGDGWDGKTKLDVDGERNGDTVTFAPSITTRAVTTGGTRADYQGTIQADEITGTDERGQPFTLTRVLRESPTLARRPPPGAIVLFDGKHNDEFVQGEANDYPNTYYPGEGGITVDHLLKEGATTLRKFRDATIHIEFRVPFDVQADPNYRGNSGVYVQGNYEVNILDSLGLVGTQNENGGIPGVRSPDLNMAFPPLSWQTFDIEFRAARWNGSNKTENARMSVTFNGVLVHEDLELAGATTHNPLPETAEPGPIFLQANPFPVRFRYLWVLEK